MRAKERFYPVCRVSSPALRSFSLLASGFSARATLVAAILAEGNIGTGAGEGGANRDEHFPSPSFPRVALGRRVPLVRWLLGIADVGGGPAAPSQALEDI